MTSIHGLTNETKVEGIGCVRWNVKDVFGKVTTIKTDAYLILNVEVRLFSPQVIIITHDYISILALWHFLPLTSTV